MTLTTTAKNPRYAVVSTGKVIGGGWDIPAVPALQVLDCLSGSRFSVLYTEKQAGFVATYLNDVDSGLVSLTNN